MGQRAGYNYINKNITVLKKVLKKYKKFGRFPITYVICLRIRLAEVCIHNKYNYKNNFLMLEPYALKNACTVLRGGKFEKIYLSRPQNNDKSKD